MIVIPAIDLLDGEVVRLYKGEYEEKTVYSKKPVKLALKFQAMGVTFLHIVDLDGARDGESKNYETIQAIRRKLHIPMQVGGGIRSLETAGILLNNLGIERIIVGTKAVESVEFLEELLNQYGGERIVVGIDVREGKVATAGWKKDSGFYYLDFIGELKKIGLRYIVVTDISRDGTLSSPNWVMYEQIKGMKIMVSGGVSCCADIQKARKYYGIIVGKAYYEGKVDLEKCLKKESSRA